MSRRPNLVTNTTQLKKCDNIMPKTILQLKNVMFVQNNSTQYNTDKQIHNLESVLLSP